MADRLTSSASASSVCELIPVVSKIRLRNASNKEGLMLKSAPSKKVNLTKHNNKYIATIFLGGVHEKTEGAGRRKIGICFRAVTK
jgi:hypothetical protein